MWACKANPIDIPPMIKRICLKILKSIVYRANYNVRHALRTITVFQQSQKFAREVSNNKKGLFIDLGSNLGQGIQYFSRFYRPTHYDYILVEPNPHCMMVLQNMIHQKPYSLTQSEILAAAASTTSGETHFFGLTEVDAASQSEGGSIVKTHNTVFYEPDEQRAIRVPTFDLAELIFNKAKQYNKIIMKVDVEGAEYDILPHLIQTDAIKHVSQLYVEFHANCVLEPLKSLRLKQEKEILAELLQHGVHVTRWI